MTRSQMREATLAIGVLVLLIGVLVVVGTTGSDLTLETATSKIIGLVAGGFLCVLGVVIIGAALDVLDDLGDIVQNIWDSFPDAIGK